MQILLMIMMLNFKATLLGNTEADGGKGILKNGTIAVPLYFLR